MRTILAIIFMTFATQASAKDAIWVLIHSIVPNDTDVTYKKRGTFSSNNILHADFFFDNLESCRDALKYRALWKMSDEDTKLLENKIDDTTPKFVTTWRDGNLFSISQCERVTSK